jgi:hypothetical protein
MLAAYWYKMKPPQCLTFAVPAALTTLSLTFKLPLCLQLHICIAYHTFHFVYPYFLVHMLSGCSCSHHVMGTGISSFNYVQGVYPSCKTDANAKNYLINLHM